MDEKEQLRAVKTIVDGCVDYGSKMLIELLNDRVTSETFARETRIKYRDALNEINLIINPMPDPEPDNPVVGVRLV